ncbi:hypothetical protein [Glaciimonas sp. PAMC28666]|uniref:hypothetical protein n=1 Tax=Glaciimonas sp. PAMC28666 TaxID=2807626 RepID=UPI0019640C91|nr:hypothetical protein [Glaciimonas sp. PAMC28666]QRX83275.1 hypothetical protein JQN73_03070 [Glaciimonas sp. PAMC28666]
MSATTNSLKDHFADGAKLLTLLAGISAVSELIAGSSESQHAVISDAAYLLSELANVAYGIAGESM